MQKSDVAPLSQTLDVTSDEPGSKRKGIIYIGLASDMELRIANHDPTFREKEL